MVARKSNFYLTREELIREIVLSKKKHRESNHPRTPAECFTPKLTAYLQLMVNRYANKGQWRGYCVDETTEALTQRGWLGINEITEDDHILSYRDGKLTWSSIRSIYRGQYKGNLFHLTVQGLDALVTPGHKFVTSDGLKPVEELREKDQLILFGKPTSAPSISGYDDAFVELVGWTVTEGCYYQDTRRSYTRVAIYQNEGEKAERIRRCLHQLGASFGEGGKVNPSGHTNVAFHLTKKLCNDIMAVAPEKALTMPFILALTAQQRELLIRTMIDADGHITYDKHLNYDQVDKTHVDSFIALCTIAGYRTSSHLRDPLGYGQQPFYNIRIFSDRRHTSMVENVDFHGAKNTERVIGKPKSLYPNRPTVPYSGMVWCPETEFGSFIARRNGTVFLTGNSYIDDMKSDALLTLCQNAFKYNEEKYDNPFGYYTQIIKYSFITYLEKEEVVRDIKDSLWESIGMAPSYARQIKNEMLREVDDTSTKGLKALKRDVDALQEKIDNVADLGSRVARLREPDGEVDLLISELLGIELLPYTGLLSAALSLFPHTPIYHIEEDIEVAEQTVNCLSVRDTSTSSQIKRIIADTNPATVVLALCSIGISIRRDLLVKRVREISGYNLNPRFPAAEERPIETLEPPEVAEFTEKPKRRRKRTQ